MRHSVAQGVGKGNVVNPGQYHTGHPRSNRSCQFLKVALYGGYQRFVTQTVLPFHIVQSFCGQNGVNHLNDFIGQTANGQTKDHPNEVENSVVGESLAKGVVTDKKQGKVSHTAEHTPAKIAVTRAPSLLTSLAAIGTIR